MKKFVEKLISRLEKEPVSSISMGKDYIINGNAMSKERVVEIVNNLFKGIDTGKLSDGYHTFNELYHHRAVLFAVICNSNKKMAWKSKLHDTGDMYEGMFIVGIETPEGQVTYHYDIDPYWDMFKVKELPKAPVWDGHSPGEAIRRITFLDGDNSGWIPCGERYPDTDDYILLSFSNFSIPLVGRWEEDEEGGAFYIGDDEVSCSSQCIFVNAWRPLPEPYKER